MKERERGVGGGGGGIDNGRKQANKQERKIQNASTCDKTIVYFVGKFKS